MASAFISIRTMVRYAQANGGSDALRDAAQALLSKAMVNGGKTMTSASANGKTFTFTIPAGTDVESYMAALEEAANIYDEKTADGTLEAYLAQRIRRRTRATFC